MEPVTAQGQALNPYITGCDGIMRLHIGHVFIGCGIDGILT